MRNFEWSFIDSSVTDIVVWGTGCWAKSFLSESIIYGIDEKKIHFTTSSGVNDGKLCNFLTYDQLCNMPNKEKVAVVIAIKDDFAVQNIAQKIAAAGHFPNVSKYAPVKANYDVLDNLTIFMLHRVSKWENGNLFSNENLKVNPSSLDRFLSFLESKNIKFYSLEDIYKSKIGKKSGVVFTMDDGYKDNLYEALPVFKKHKAPFTIFITTDFPNKKAVLWWYELEDLILANSSITLSNGMTYDCSTAEKKEKTFLEIRGEILKLDQTKLAKELNSFFSRYDIDWHSKNDDLCLSWEDIKILKKEPLVTIGAHTEHHYNLKQLHTKEDVKKEVCAGIEILKKEADINANVFAYPFGSANEVGNREISVLKDFADINCACLAYGGTIKNKSGNILCALPRIMLTEEFIEKTIDNKL